MIANERRAQQRTREPAAAGVESVCQSGLVNKKPLCACRRALAAVNATPPPPRAAPGSPSRDTQRRASSSRGRAALAPAAPGGAALQHSTTHSAPAMWAARLDGSTAAPGVGVQLRRVKLPLRAGRCRRASTLRGAETRAALVAAPAHAPWRRSGACPCARRVALRPRRAAGPATPRDTRSAAPVLAERFKPHELHAVVCSLRRGRARTGPATAATRRCCT